MVLQSANCNFDVSTLNKVTGSNFVCKGVTGASGDFLQSESCDADAAAVNLVADTQFYCHPSGGGNLDGGKQCSTMLADLETLFVGTQAKGVGA